MQRLSVYVVCKKERTPFDSRFLASIPAVLFGPGDKSTIMNLWLAMTFSVFQIIYFYLPPLLPGDYAACHWEQALAREELGHGIQCYCRCLSLWERLWLPNSEHQRKPQLNVHMFPNCANIPDTEKHPDAKVNFKISKKMLAGLSMCHWLPSKTRRWWSLLFYIIYVFCS